MEITLFYTSLITLLAIFLAYKVGIARGRSKTLLGEGDSSALLQAIRSHGNLVEYAPLAMIMLGLLEISGVDQLCLLYTSPSPRDRQKSRMPSSA